MLECSRRVLWDWANPANFPFSCSSSSASFLLASSNFRIRFLKHLDSWSCETNKNWHFWTGRWQKCKQGTLDTGGRPVTNPECDNMITIHLILQLQHLLLVLLQLCGGQGDHFLQLLLQHCLVIGHNLQLCLQSLYLFLVDKWKNHTVVLDTLYFRHLSGAGASKIQNEMINVLLIKNPAQEQR